jgi:hypothetical protein
MGYVAAGGDRRWSMPLETCGRPGARVFVHHPDDG